MSKADALRRALVILDELEPLVECVASEPYEYPTFAAELHEAIKTARGEVYGEMRSEYVDEPPHDVTALRVLRVRLTRALGWEEQKAMKAQPMAMAKTKRRATK